MPPKNLICIVVDRLHAGMVGAYGNSWIRTDQLDRIASDSWLFDQALVDTPRLDRLYDAYWLGITAPATRKDRGRGASFAELVQTAGLSTTLLTDESQVAEHPVAQEFAEQVLLVPSAEAPSVADVSETQMARLFGSATDWLQKAQGPFCLWIHAQAMGGAWDAPLNLRNKYADEEDPQPPEFTSVPNELLKKSYDPDDLLGITHAYAGQVAALDLCLGAFWDHLQRSRLLETTAVSLTSARGFPLGEHRRVGVCDEPLYNELVQLVWMLRFPDGLGRLGRSSALVQPADLPGTLLDWLGASRGGLGPHASSLLGLVAGEADAIRDRVYLISQNDRAIRTPAWLLRQDNEGLAELYAKPSDRWEVNEVARLCGDIVAGLQSALAQIEQAEQGAELPPLEESLVTEVD